MRKRYNRLTLLLVFTMLIATVTVQAAGGKGFSDVTEDDWHYKNVMDLVEIGAIAGYPNGTFRPDNTITGAEFVKVAISSVQNGKVEAAPVGTHWASEVFKDAIKLKVLTSNEVDLMVWDEPITRYEMVRIMVRVIENVLDERSIHTLGVFKIMGDFDTVQQKMKYAYYVEQAYMKGLLAGMDQQGTFAGERTGKRSEAAAMIVRMLDDKSRMEVNVSQIKTDGGEIALSDAYRTLAPEEGDVIIKKDGSKITLKFGPSGVLGENQGIDYYSGVKLENGSVFEEGDTGITAMGCDGSIYLVDKITGEGHFREDWLRIQTYYYNEALKIKNPKEGQMSGTWFLYINGQWCTTAPIN